MKKHFILLFIVSVVIYILLLILVKLDSDFTYRWWLLLLYFINLLIFPLSIIIDKRKTLQKQFSKIIKKLKTPAGKKDLWLFLIIVLLAIVTRFLFLKSYPFLTWGDELWEAGLDSLAIISGEIKNFYIVGFPDTYRMPSMGYIQSLVSIPFAPFFSHTPLMYRLTASLIGITNILFIYLICRKHINQEVAIFTTLALIALPIHIYFSRTEVVIISNALITTCTIYLLFLTFHRFFRNTRWLALVGLWIGFTITFQTATRLISLISLGIILLFYTIRISISKNQSANWINKLISLGKYFIILFVFAFVGFGPKILFITPKTFLHSETSVLFQDIKSTEFIKLTPKTIMQFKTNFINVFSKRYPESFLGYINKPLTNLVEFHYTEEKPLLPPLLAIIFIIGLVSLFWVKFPLARWFGFFALLIPLTHSALTPELNWSYRLFVAASSCAVMIGIGMWQITSKITFKIVKYGLISAFCLYLLYIIGRFFISEPQFDNRPVEEYITTHLSYFLQKHESEYANQKVCLKISPIQNKFLDWVHAHNQYKYFAPSVDLTVIPDYRVKVNTVYLQKNCLDKPTYQNYTIFCSQNLNFICPKPSLFRQQNEPDEINKDIIIYY